MKPGVTSVYVLVIKICPYEYLSMLRLSLLKQVQVTGYNIVSLNTRGLADKTKRKELLTWLELKNAKIVFLQESHSTLSSENDWKNQWTGNIFMSHGTSNSRGTCILIHRCVPINLHKYISDPDGRYVILDIDIDGVRVTLGSIYGPNEENPEFYVNAIQQIESIPNDNRIIGGILT